MSDGPAWKLEDDRQNISVTFPTDPPVELRLDAAGINDLLHGVGGLRAVMLPEHSYDDPRGQKLTNVVPDPRWSTEHDLLLGNILIHLRDPRFGTLSYLLNRDEARALGQSLVDLSNAPQDSPSGKAN
jgi:hypothetical protein